MPAFYGPKNGTCRFHCNDLLPLCPREELFRVAIYKNYFINILLHLVVNGSLL